MEKSTKNELLSSCDPRSAGERWDSQRAACSACCCNLN